MLNLWKKINNAGLRSAVTMQNTSLTRQLLVNGADPNQIQNDTGISILMEAVSMVRDQSASIDIVDLLVVHGADLGARDNDDRSMADYAQSQQALDHILIQAVKNDHHVLMRESLIKGACVDSRYGSEQLTPLMILLPEAHRSEHRIDMMQELVAAGADLMIRDANGKYVVDYARHPTIRDYIEMQQDQRDFDAIKAVLAKTPAPIRRLPHTGPSPA